MARTAAKDQLGHPVTPFVYLHVEGDQGEICRHFWPLLERQELPQKFLTACSYFLLDLFSVGFSIFTRIEELIAQIEKIRNKKIENSIEKFPFSLPENYLEYISGVSNKHNAVHKNTEEYLQKVRLSLVDS